MFLMIWQFEVEEAHAADFEKAYGAEGAWAQFFRRSKRYRRTELVRDLEDSSRYLTLDYWETEKDFVDFKNSHNEEYHRLDQYYHGITKREIQIGAFVPIGRGAESR